MAATRRFREVWVDENDLVPRPWRDLEPKEKPRVDVDRSHVTSVEEDGE